MFEKNENKQKDAGLGHFKTNSDENESNTKDLLIFLKTIFFIFKTFLGCQSLFSD